MGVLLNADADYLSFAGGPAATGLTTYTIWCWHRRTSGVGFAATQAANIIGMEGNGGRHNRFSFDNTFVVGGEDDARLALGDSGGIDGGRAFPSGEDRPAFDTWSFYAMVAQGKPGEVRLTGYWLSAAGAISGTNVVAMGSTESSITPATVLFGRNVAADPNTSQGDYAYAGARAYAMSRDEIRALAYRTAAAVGDWAYWRLANAADLADTSGNGRTLTANGTVTDGADPTIVTPGATFIPRPSYAEFPKVQLREAA